MRHSRWILGPVVALSLITVPSVAADARAHQSDPAPGITATALSKPQVRLNGPKHGKAALKALVGQLDQAASLNRTSIKKLHDVLATDPTAWISQTGRLFYSDKFERPAARTSATSAAASVPPAPEPLANTFHLHSIPGGADHTIYLDFNGYTLGAGSWVDNGWTKGSYKGFSLDSDYSTFSDSERAYVQHVWQVISEKYAPFDIDVTTEDPGPDAYNRNGVGDPTYGDHVVFTDVATGSGAKPAGVCPDGCDGISFNSAFDDPTDNVNDAEPVWVYTGFYHWYSGLAGEIGAHEVGHTLGLEHDGLGTGTGAYGSGNDAYYQGGDLWSPVMGAGVGALTQFSKGEYANASNTEDDFAVMQNHGVNLRPDDWGDLATPSDLGAASSYSEDGVIEDAADTDAFIVAHSCSAPLRVTATGIGAGQTVDLAVTLRSPLDDSILTTGGDFTSANTTTYPRTPQNADATAVLDPPMNSVLVEVSGVGQGLPGSDVDGYSDYGSVGRYHLAISGCLGVDGATPGAPTGLTATQTPKTGTVTLGWSAPASAGDSAITGYRISGFPSGTTDVASTDRSAVFTGLDPGTQYDITIAAVNAYGAGPVAAVSKTLSRWVTPALPKVSLSAYGTTLVVRWTEPPNPGRALPSKWQVGLYDDKGNWLQYFPTDYGHSGLKITGMGNGRYEVRTWLEYGNFSSRSLINDQKVDVGPSAPRIGTPSSGTSGGTSTATVRWAAPATLRGQTITSYLVGAYKLDSSGRIVKVYVSSPRKASARSYVWALPKGRYKFRVQAHSQGGYTPISTYSTTVTSR